MPPTSLKTHDRHGDEDDRLDDAENPEHDAGDRDAAVGGFPSPGPLQPEETENDCDDAEHHAADNRENSAMIATISAAMPSPFFGPTGGGVNPE